MAKLGIMDILSFAKAGYSPKDVKELMEIDVPDKEPEPKNPKDSQSPEQKSAAENAPKASVNDTQAPDEPKTGDIDYKKLYEQEAEKVKQLQQKNTKKEASNKDPEDPMKAVDDFLRDFM